GLVTAERDGRHITYSLYDNHVASLLDQAVYHAEHVRLGDPDTTTQLEDTPSAPETGGPATVPVASAPRLGAAIGGDG
ncbi:MAG: hypothetical protein ABI181_12990, partial [Mycobacteriaceae bacterium]